MDGLVELVKAVGATRANKDDLVIGKHGIFLKTVGSHETNSFAAQDAPVRVWIAGKDEDFHSDGSQWDLIGIFDSEEKAVAACEAEASENVICAGSEFVAPFTLNEILPVEKRTMPGCYYPLLKKQEA